MLNVKKQNKKTALAGKQLAGGRRKNNAGEDTLFLFAYTMFLMYYF